MPEQIMQNGSIRCYYKITVNPNAADKAIEAKGQGITRSILAHELPVYRRSPDGATAIVRVHWPAAGTGRATYEGKGYVTPITDLEAADLVASWVEA